MIKRSPSRNPRSKGIKVKHVLQICVLLAVSFWLIYQVKHSHDKKKEFDEKDSKVSLRAQSGDETLIKFGRKDPRPLVPKLTNNDKNDEDEEEETGVEEQVTKEEEIKHEKEEEEEEETKHNEDQEEEEEKEGNKHEETTREVEIKNREEDEEEAKIEETEDDGQGGGDDEIDEHDPEKIAGETDHEDDFVDEEKEREDEFEKENESNEGEDEAKLDGEILSEDQDHDAAGGNSREAREEHYKADDASSAVTHDTQIISTESEKISSENSNESSARNDMEENISNNIDDNDGNKSESMLEMKQGELPENNPLNVTSGNENGDEIVQLRSEDQVPENITVASVIDEQAAPSNKSTDLSMEVGNNSTTGEGTENTDSSQQHEMITFPDSSVQNKTVDWTTVGEGTNIQTAKLEEVNNSLVSDSRQFDSNATFPDGTENGETISMDSLNSSIKADAYGQKDLATLPDIKNESAETNVNNESGETDEKSGSSTTYENEVVINDAIDASDLQLAKEARIDLSTLPDSSTTEGVNTRDAAAE